MDNLETIREIQEEHDIDDSTMLQIVLEFLAGDDRGSPPTILTLTAFLTERFSGPRKIEDLSDKMN